MINSTSVSISLRNGIVATGNTDAVTLWDINTGNELATLPYAVNRQLVLSPEGDRILINGFGEIYPDVALSDINGNEIARGTSSAIPDDYEAVAFNADGSVIAAARNNSLLLWSTDTIIANGSIGIQIVDHQIPESHRSQIWQLTFAPSSLYLVTGDADGNLRIWAVSSGESATIATDNVETSNATPTNIISTPTQAPLIPLEMGNLNTTLSPQQPVVRYGIQVQSNVSYDFLVGGRTEVRLLDASGTIVATGQEIDRNGDTPIMGISEFVSPSGGALILEIRSLNTQTTEPVIIVFQQTPDPLADFECPGTLAPRLSVGDTARVIPGPANNLRTGPGLSAGRNGQIPGGSVFTVTGGPVCADGYVWWEIDYNGVIAWTAEAAPDEYWLEVWE